MTMPRLAALAALSLLVPLACLAAPKGKAAIEARCRAEALADHIMADEIDDQVAACVKQTLNRVSRDPDAGPDLETYVRPGPARPTTNLIGPTGRYFGTPRPRPAAELDQEPDSADLDEDYADADTDLDVDLDADLDAGWEGDAEPGTDLQAESDSAPSAMNDLPHGDDLGGQEDLAPSQLQADPTQ